VLLRLHSEKTGDVRIYDLSNISEEDAAIDFVSVTNDENPDGSYFDFQVVRKSELEWWVRTGGEA
jgi:hypothetical protein